MDVAEETFLAAVLHLDRALRRECQQTTVHLQADVLSRSEGTAHTAEHEANSLDGETKTRSNLFLVLVKLLRRDVKFDATAVCIGNGHRSFESEECLVLHADLIITLDDDVTFDGGVTVHDALMSKDVAVRVDRRH